MRRRSRLAASVRTLAKPKGRFGHYGKSGLASPQVPRSLRTPRCKRWFVSSVAIVLAFFRTGATSAKYRSANCDSDIARQRHPAPPGRCGTVPFAVLCGSSNLRWRNRRCQLAAFSLCSWSRVIIWERLPLSPSKTLRISPSSLLRFWFVDMSDELACAILELDASVTAFALSAASLSALC